jgi:mannose-6-phosphate isomerase-like protein (cupin superfamily)
MSQGWWGIMIASKLVPANETRHLENTCNSSLLLLMTDQPSWEAENEEIMEGTQVNYNSAKD